MRTQNEPVKAAAALRSGSGIDCIVRQGPRRYIDVQIKTRSAEVVPKNSGYFPQLNNPTPRKNYVFVLDAEAVGDRAPTGFGYRAYR